MKKKIIGIFVMTLLIATIFSLTVYARDTKKPLSAISTPKVDLFTTNIDKVSYKFLIISPESFSLELQSIKTHKEQHGISTIIVTLKEIFNSTYFPSWGRDDAEKVKYFIKNAFDTWETNYVLLVGGRKPDLQEKWFMPVRYVNVYLDPGPDIPKEYQYISDLYFADIYDVDHNFSSWDTDDNNVFGEWKRSSMLKDKMDLYPDVYIGRWACRNKQEVKIMVKKTISYESNIASKRIVLAGGDAYPPEGKEGELTCDKSLSYLPGFEGEKIYQSMGDITAKAILDGIKKGAAFIHLHGHGNPVRWSNPKPDFHGSERGLNIWNTFFLFNEEYPILINGGCHTAMFNISLMNHPWSPIPFTEDMSWYLASKNNGGTIASLGYTAFPCAYVNEYGDLDKDGINEPDCVESGMGYLETNLFYAYGIEGMEYLGECWGYTINKYIDCFKIPADRCHIHNIHSFVLLGDPTLKIGGYS